MSYLVLNRRKRNDCNKLLPYFNIFYNQGTDNLKAKPLKNNNFKEEKNIFVANNPATNQICVLPITYKSTVEDETKSLQGIF